MSEEKELPKAYKGRIPLKDLAMEHLRKYKENSHLPPLDRLPQNELDGMLLTLRHHPEVVTIQAEVNADFAQRQGITNDLTWGAKEIWISVKDVAEALELKKRFRAQGYRYMETFMGSLREEELHWVLKADKRDPIFPDPEGNSKKLYELLKKLGVEPLFVMSGYSTGSHADIELTMENLAALTVLFETNAKHNEKSGQDGAMELVLSRNYQDAVDVIALHVNPKYEIKCPLSLDEVKGELFRLCEADVDYAPGAPRIGG